jgi:hypothetical protein
VERDRARHAIVRVDASDLQAIEAAVFVQEVVLDPDGLPVALFL